MKIPIKTNQAGFTLIEFIVTLVIAASAAAMLYAFMGTTLTRSSEPIFHHLIYIRRFLQPENRLTASG